MTKTGTREKSFPRERHPMQASRIRIIFIALTALLVALGIVTARKQKNETITQASITIAAVPMVGSSLIYIAHWNNYFRDEGLNVLVVNYSSGKKTLDALVDGRADFAMASGPSVALSLMRGRKAFIIATMGYSNRIAAIVARKDRGISKPADLSGKTVAVSEGTNSDYYLDSFLLMHEMSRKDVRIVDRNPDQIVEALAGGAVDAVSTVHPYTAALQRRMGDAVVIFLEDWIFNTTFNLVASESMVREGTATELRVLRALRKALDYARKNPSEARVMAEKGGGMEPGSLTDVWTTFNFDVSLNDSLVEYLSAQLDWARTTYFPGMEKPNPLNAIDDRPLRKADPAAVSLAERSGP